ncbi:MAG: alpha-E domain-containing protein [Luteolibacter sp.]|jgi:uncharacterized alpha-E superfamily protein
MLSRVANTLYWMVRYIERADNLARLIDVNQQQLLDSERLDSERLREFWRPIILCTGDEEAFYHAYDHAGSHEVVRFLTDDPANPNSIVSCIALARENARMVRDQLSDDLWQELNDLYLFSRSQEAAVLSRIDPSRFYQNIRRAAFTIHGIATSTMRRSQGWEFMDLGRQLERADKTTRFLDISSYLSPERDLPETAANKAAALHWTAILRSCGAIGAFRASRLGFTPREVIGFLVFSGDFPRSVRYCVDRIDTSLHRVSGTPRGSYSNAAERISGKLLANLNFGSPDDVFETGLHEYLDHMQTLFNKIGDEIFDTYVLMPDKILPHPSGFSEPAFASHASTHAEAQMQQQQ